MNVKPINQGASLVTNATVKASKEMLQHVSNIARIETGTKVMPSLDSLQAYSGVNVKVSDAIGDVKKNILIFLGAPNAGKGTFSNKISKLYDIPQISTGDILKKERRAGSELGKLAQQYIDEGKFVPDDVVIKIVEKRIKDADCRRGFILDGFPRTVAQAEKLSEILKDLPNVRLKVINLDVQENVLYTRSATRVICEDCSKSFNTRHYHGKVCDETGGKLIKRSDDNPKTLRKRLGEYDELTRPVAMYYIKSGNFANLKIGARPKREVNSGNLLNKLVDLIEKEPKQNEAAFSNYRIR